MGCRGLPESQPSETFLTSQKQTYTGLHENIHYSE